MPGFADTPKSKKRSPHEQVAGTGERPHESASQLEIQKSALCQAHSQVENLLDALRADGEVQNSEIIASIRKGDSDDSVLAIASRIARQNQKVCPQPQMKNKQNNP